MKKIVLGLMLSFFFLTAHNSIQANEELILFHSDTCGYCDQVIDVVEEHNLKEILGLKMIERSEEDFEEIFTSSLEECGLDPNRGGYPTLYHNGECSTGSISAVSTLLDLAGIEIEEEEYEKDSDEEDKTPANLDQTEEEEKEEFEPEPRPLSHIFIMIIGPILLIGLGYFMIRKLNL